MITSAPHDGTAVRVSRDLDPWYGSFTVTTAGSAAALAHRWFTACLPGAGVAPADRSRIRTVGVELAREAARAAHPGDPVLVELDVVGPIARVSARGPATTPRLGARAVESLRSAYEWGVEQVSGGRRVVWCHLEIA